MPFPWLEVAAEAVTRWQTPLYIGAWTPVAEAIDELSPLLELRVPSRIWLSVKTQPVKPLLVGWRDRGLGAEVVSRFELMAVQSAGFSTENILVNGVAKHTWLPPVPNLRVHLDSLEEVKSIDVDNLRLYRLGARCQIGGDHDPADSTIGGQFGMVNDELCQTVSFLRRHGLQLDGLHFHLRSNIRDPAVYLRAFEEAVEMGARAEMNLKYVDFGGGFPVPGEATWEENRWAREPLPMRDLVVGLNTALAAHPSIQEVWFENGRFVSSRSAVLVLKVLDIKERSECRYVICDGGRTNNALPSDWQSNALATLPPRSDAEVLTVVCGPTCTAYDRLVRRQLPRDISIGDYLVWFNAGAYHLSWETRFSHGLARMVWCDDQLRLTVAREGEDFDRWWGTWA